QVANLQTWQDLNGNGRMDPGEVSRTTTLGPAFTNARVVASNRTDADGGVVYTFLVRSNDGNVSLNVTLAQRFERIDGAIPSPMAFTGPSASNPYGLTLSYSLGTSAPASTVVQHTTLGVRSAVYEIRRTASPEVRGDLPLFAGTFAAVATLVGATIVLASRRAKHREETGRKP